MSSDNFEVNDSSADINFVKFIVEALVDFPESVRIERQIDDMGVLLMLYVNKKDMGKVIGKEGKIIGAIRTLLKALGMRLRARINLKIYEPEGEEEDAPREESSSFRSNNEDAPREEYARSSASSMGDPTKVDDLV